jgi:1-aminocyclopropane-1-carboxylate deaminase/D-cysteine desulfhydrase-like pyridoxal-dependent ACC family enzyme
VFCWIRFIRPRVWLVFGLAKEGFFDDDKDVVFLHTGGAMALFAYGEECTK